MLRKLDVSSCSVNSDEIIIGNKSFQNVVQL